MVRKKWCDKAVFLAERGVLGALVEEVGSCFSEGERRKGGGGLGVCAGFPNSTVKVRQRKGRRRSPAGWPHRSGQPPPHSSASPPDAMMPEERARS